MYSNILRAQWKSIAAPLLILALVVFAVPVWQLVGATGFYGGGRPELAIPVLGALLATSGIYPLMAYATGSALAIGSWYDDFQGKHVYALVLPVPRWYYLLLRMAAGLTLVGALVAALWLSAVVASAQISLPPGLHAYPGGLAVRFALAASVSFVLTFVMCSGSRRMLRTLGLIFIGVVVLLVLVGVMGATSPLNWIADHIARWPSILDAFTGRWLLIDV
jgi:hypothetical protein